MPSPISIHTKRLILRDLLKSDFNAVHSFASDPVVSEHSTWGPNTEEKTHQWLEDALSFQLQNPRNVFELAISKENSGIVIGTCRIAITNSNTREAEVGYTLIKNEWGNGYATESAQALLEFGFNSLKMHRIFATASPLNHPSHKVLEKIGMKREGLLRKNVIQRETWRDSLIFAILEEDWFHQSP